MLVVNVRASDRPQTVDDIQMSRCRAYAASSATSRCVYLLIILILLYPDTVLCYDLDSDALEIDG